MQRLVKTLGSTPKGTSTRCHATRVYQHCVFSFIKAISTPFQSLNACLLITGVTGKKLIDGNEGRALSRGPRMDVLERVAAGQAVVDA